MSPNLKCLFSLCIFLMMCPKRIRQEKNLPSAPSPMRQFFQTWVHEYKPDISMKTNQPGSSVFEDYKSKSIWSLNNANRVNLLKKEMSPARWASDIMQDKNTNRLRIAEPGFDLTEDEIVKFKIWPQGVIPYYIDDFSFDKVLRDRIRSFLEVINEVTGLHFLELPMPPDDEKTRWVIFINRRGQLDCADHTIDSFTNEGVQKVILGYDCMSTSGELADAVLSLAGIPPQHNSPDRSNYIHVDENNIIPEKKYLFQQLNDTDWLFHDVEYDLNSAGHYHWHKYTMNGAATIRPMFPVDFDVGQGNGFSYSDIWKIRMLYNYISRKRSNFKGPECQKMFEPGANFSRFHPESPDEIEPRKKPNKYLGIEEESPIQPNSNETNIDDKSQDENNDTFTDQGTGTASENVHSNEEKIKQIGVDSKDTISESSNIKSEEEDKSQEDNSHELDKYSDVSSAREETKKSAEHNFNRMKVKTQPLKNPFEVLSDYNTDERNKRQKFKLFGKDDPDVRRFTNPGGRY